MENLNLDCLKKIVEKKKIFFYDDGTIQNIKKVFSNFLYYYFDDKENKFLNIDFYDCSFNDYDDMFFIDVFVDDEKFCFHFDDVFFELFEQKKLSKKCFQFFLKDICYNIYINDNDLNYNYKLLKILIEKENYIENFLNNVFDLYILLNDIFKNGDKNNIFNNNENFINYCLINELD